MYVSIAKRTITDDNSIKVFIKNFYQNISCLYCMENIDKILVFSVIFINFLTLYMPTMHLPMIKFDGHGSY